MPVLLLSRSGADSVTRPPPALVWTLPGAADQRIMKPCCARGLSTWDRLLKIRWMLLCCQGRFCELVVEVAGEVSLEGAHGLSFGLSFGDLALHVGAAWGVVD